MTRSGKYGMAAAAARFGPRRIAAWRSLWRLLTQAAKPGGPGVVETLRAVPRMAAAVLTGRYGELGAGRLLLFALAAGYLLSPVDLVPELLLTVFGIVDDAIVALWLGGAVLAETHRFLLWERSRPVVVDGELVDARTA